MYPGYERYWTAIQNEPDKPASDYRQLPTPAEVEWARFVAQHPALCAVEHACLGVMAEHALRPRPRTRSPTSRSNPARTSTSSAVARTTASLIDAGLVDELRLLVYPLVAGNGKALFATADRRRELELSKAEQLPDGRVSLIYASG